MKYYIIKPKTRPVNEKIIEGVKHVDPEAVIVDNLNDCNIAILQNNWSRSKAAVREYYDAHSLKKKISWAEFYLDYFVAHLNKGENNESNTTFCI